MPLFGHKDKDKDHHKDKDTASIHSSHHASGHGHAGADADNEYKYERVEKIDVDTAGNAQLTDVRVDRGAEDPGMNYKDKRPPGLVPGAPVGMVPGSSRLEGDTGSVHSVHTLSGPNYNEHGHGGRSISTVGSIEPSLARGEYMDNSSHVSRSHHQHSVHTTGSNFPVTAGASQVLRDSTSQGGNSRLTSSTTEVIRQENLVRGGPGREFVEAGPGYRQANDTLITAGSGRAVHEVHETLVSPGSTTHQVDVITVPVHRMDTSRMAHERSGYTYTQDKDLVIAGPMLAPPIPSQKLDFSGGSHAEIHSNTSVDLLSLDEVDKLGPEEYARYRAKVEDLARQHEAEVASKAAQYRNLVEADAELIRRTLERQHIRDIEFRKDMVESSVDRQQHEIQLEAEYAMRALENERDAARRALEQAKAQTNVDVRIDTAIGNTVSRGNVTTTSEHASVETVVPSTRV